MKTRKCTLVFERTPNWFFGVGGARFVGFVFVLRFGPWAIKLTVLS